MHSKLKLIRKAKTPLIIVFLFFILSAFSWKIEKISYTSKERFPMSSELEDAVKFWIKIYSQYSTNDCVIHDSRRLDVIYEVVRWDSPEKGKIEFRRTRKQRRILRNKKRTYRSILLQLASPNVDYQSLKGEQKRIFNLFGGTTNRSVYRNASRRIRVQVGQKNRFRKGLQISGRYMDYIEKIFKQHDLPLELTVLPHVESSFNYQAYSTAGAAGIWQFTRGTGRKFLEINYEIDQRFDPILSSEAAAKLLKENYQVLGSWPLAITAYNHGLTGMRRAKRRLGTSDIAKIIAKYRSRYFRFASRNFYCEFLAALHVTQNYKKYFGDVTFDPPLRYREFELPHYLKVSSVANYFGLPVDEIKKYNPSLRYPIFKGTKYLPKSYLLKLPPDIQPEKLYAKIPDNELYVAQKRTRWYKVRRGDNLARIARRHNTSISTLMAMNDIRNAHYIRAGEVLRLPEIKINSVEEIKETQLANAQPETHSETKTGLGGAEEFTSSPSEEAETETTAEIEKPKSEIDLSVEEIAQNTQLNTDLEIVKDSKPKVGYIVIEPEETLGHYADWLKIPTQRIRNWNGIPFGRNIHLGQKIKLVFEKISPQEFNAHRLEFHRAIEEDFFSHYDIIGTNTHRVRHGENIWYLCNYMYNLPYWLIKSYNTDLNLEALKPGDLIVIPQVSAKEISS